MDPKNSAASSVVDESTAAAAAAGADAAGADAPDTVVADTDKNLEQPALAAAAPEPDGQPLSDSAAVDQSATDQKLAEEQKPAIADEPAAETTASNAIDEIDTGIVKTIAVERDGLADKTREAETAVRQTVLHSAFGIRGVIEDIDEHIKHAVSIADKELEQALEHLKSLYADLAGTFGALKDNPTIAAVMKRENPAE